VAIKIGFIGCGRVSENHYEAVRKCKNAQLVAVSDIDMDLARWRATEWGVSALSCDEICEKDGIDAIFVLTPPSVHYHYAVKALLGHKHVLVEKPISFEMSEIRSMERIAENEGRVCMPGHNYIYLPELRRGMELVREGKIGKPAVMYTSEIYFMPPDLARKYLGPTREVLWHHIYLMLAYIGVPEKICAFRSHFRNADIPSRDEQVMVNAMYASGTLVHLFVSWAVEDETSDPWTFKVKVLGTAGGFHFSRRDVVSVKGEGSWEYPLYQEMFDREIDYFVNECILGGSKPLSSLREAGLTLHILNAIEASLENSTVETIRVDELDH